MSYMNIDKSMWNKLEVNSNETEKIVRPSINYAQDIWRRFRKNKLAIFGLIIIVALSLSALILPSVYPYKYSDQNLQYNNIPPKLEIFKIDKNNYVFVTKDFRLIQTSAKGKLIAEVPLLKENKTNRTFEYELDGNEIIINYNSIFVNKKELEIFDTVINQTYILGSDSLGRDLFIRVIYGAKISLFIGFVTAFINLIIGVVYGGISGYLGGKVDNIMMRIVDIISTIPMMLYVILLMIVMGAGLKTIIIAISITCWVNMARIVRGQVMYLKEQEYILAAKSLGASLPRILFKHLIPNAMGPIIVALTMLIPDAIFTEAFLSFIGLGVSAPQASWGTLCQDALSGLYTYPYQLFYPTLAICITLISFNLLGDGFRDSLDPRLLSRRHH